MPRIQPIPWEDLTPAQRETMQTGMKTGAVTDPLPLQIMAYADHAAPPEDGDRHPNYPRHLLGGKLLELLRIRSAQLGGCEPCMASRKVEGATDEVVACLANPDLRSDLSARERLALDYLELLATDHHRIDDATYRRLAAHFTVAEIVELGMTCGGMIGMHRFMHTLNIFGDTEPAIAYDPVQVGAAWSDLHPQPSSVNVA